MEHNDWKQIRAAQWQAAQGKRSSSPTTAWGVKWLPQISIQHAVIAALLLLLASALHRRCENFGLNRNDTLPDARSRPAYSHRAYILDKADFVDVYSRRASRPNGTGWDAEEELFVAGVSRCATSQFAVTSYLCGKAVAATDGKLHSIDSPAGLRQYISALDVFVQDADWDTCSQWPELVLRFNLGEATDKSVGHTFVLHFLPEGGVQVYQSFITHYTLHTYLASHGPLDAAGLERFINNMEVVTNATAWGPREDAAYKDNFMVSLAATREKTAVGRDGISMHAEPACLVVPWQGPQVDEDDPEFEEMLDELLEERLPPVAGAAPPPLLEEE